MRSTEFARYLRAWFRDKKHNFRAANFGITAAKCTKCGLVVTIRGRIFSSTHTWLPNDIRKFVNFKAKPGSKLYRVSHYPKKIFSIPTS